jgi:PIN domain nuclease of toxin-antitoxin system
VNGFLLDTHVWLWHLRGDDSLSIRARELIDSSVEDCWLSPVSIWEAGILHERGRIRIHGDLRRWVDESRRKLPLRVALLSVEVAVASFEIDLPHRDPADRFLAATATVHELTLITADRRLLDCAAVETVSARG